MDRTDERILDLMKGNARISFQELGDELGISRIAARKRVLKLEKEGVIRGYNTYICRPEEVMAFVDLETKEECADQVIDFMATGTEGIRQIFRIDETKIHFVVVSDSVDNLKYMVRMIRESCKDSLADENAIRVSMVREVIKDVYGGIRHEKDQGRGTVSNSSESS